MHAPYRARQAGSGVVSALTLALLAVAPAFGEDAPAAGDAKKPSQAVEIAEIKRAEPVDFAKDILPIFRANCTACHNATDHEAELSLETPAAIHKGGESGGAVKAGKGAESLLLQVS